MENNIYHGNYLGPSLLSHGGMDLDVWLGYSSLQMSLGDSPACSDVPIYKVVWSWMTPPCLVLLTENIGREYSYRNPALRHVLLYNYLNDQLCLYLCGQCLSCSFSFYNWNIIWQGYLSSYDWEIRTNPHKMKRLCSNSRRNHYKCKTAR